MERNKKKAPPHHLSLEIISAIHKRNSKKSQTRNCKMWRNVKLFYSFIGGLKKKYSLDPFRFHHTDADLKWINLFRLNILLGSEIFVDVFLVNLLKWQFFTCNPTRPRQNQRRGKKNHTWKKKVFCLWKLLWGNSCYRNGNLFSIKHALQKFKSQHLRLTFVVGMLARLNLFNYSFCKCLLSNDSKYARCEFSLSEKGLYRIVKTCNQANICDKIL